MTGAGTYIPLILAAGRGQRMGGRPKALLQIAGRTTLSRCLDTCHAARQLAPVGQPVVVLGHGRLHVAAHHSTLRFANDGVTTEPRYVTNPEPDRGQTSSVQVALAAARERAAMAGVLIWPVDHPFVQATDLAALVEEAGAHSEARVVLPSHAGRAGHPALVTTALADAILALPPEAPLRQLIRAERPTTRFVERQHPGVTLDLDTPEDLERALERLTSRES